MNQKKILVVEDEVILGIDLREKLKNLGYRPYPEVIRYGEEVLEAAQKSKPDLILMDIQLKGEMNGIQAAIFVQDTINIPVIFLTAFADNKTLENAKKAGPYGYLKKPVKDEDLQIALEIGLNKSKMERQLKEKIIELQEAQDSIKLLTGLIQICAHCRNIRDETGHWDNLENYITNHTQLVLSHGMCPTCLEECYGDEDWYTNVRKTLQQKN